MTIQANNANQQPTSERIIEHIRKITHLMEIVLDKNNFPSTIQNALAQINVQMSGLLNVIKDSIKLNSKDLQIAFDTLLTYHPLSEKPQKLSLALAYLYIGLQHLGRKYHFNFFEDSNHQALALGLIQKNRPVLESIINP